VSRSLVALLLLLSLGLLGSSTCHFSASSGGKKRISDGGEGVEVIVDTRTGTAGAGAGAEMVQTVLATRPGPDSPHAPAPGRAPLAPGPAGSGPGLPPGPELATRPRAEAPGAPLHAAPEPGAGLLFAAGCIVLARHLRSRRRPPARR